MGQGSIATAMFDVDPEIGPPANILFISVGNFFPILRYLQEKGYNVLPMFEVSGKHSPLPQGFTEAESLWKSFLTGTTVSEEKCSETSECKWRCLACEYDSCNDSAGQGFENFSKHCSSENMLWS